MLLVATLTVMLCLEFVTSKTGPLISDSDSASQFNYIMSYVTIVATLVSTFVAVRVRKLSLIIKMALIIASANLVLLDYYLFYDSQRLFCLGILAVAYLMLMMPRRE